MHIYIYMFRFQVLPVRGYPAPAWYGSHHGRQGPPTVPRWQQLHEQKSQSTLHGRSGDHARDIIQHTPCIIHHITHNSAYTTCCVDIAPGVYLCVLHPSVQNAPFHRGEGKIMMMCVRVDTAPGMYLRVLHVLMVCSLCCGYQPYVGGPSHCAKLVHIYIPDNIYAVCILYKL